MKSVYLLKLFLIRTAKRYASMFISVLLAGIICFCIASSIEKDISEKAARGFYPEEAVYFTVECDEPFNIWSMGLDSVYDISYLDEDMEEVMEAHLKHISFNPELGKLYLPPMETEYTGRITASEWNSSSDICYAGKELQIRENPDTGRKYYYFSYNVYYVSGIMGYYKTSYLDNMLYVPYNGDIVPPEPIQVPVEAPVGDTAEFSVGDTAGEPADESLGETVDEPAQTVPMTVYIAEGRDRDSVLNDIQSISDKYKGEITIKITDNYRGGAPLLSRETFILYFIGVSSFIFIFMIYIWFCSLEKEMYILHLFGVQKKRIFTGKFMPLLLSLIIPYFVGMGTVYILSPYFVTNYIIMWAAGLICIAAVLVCVFIAGALKLRSIKDASNKIK